MSGRLIILPKKSWHPGKRENIEKVLRDERLASEEAAQARERAREVTQEGIVETLSKKRSLEGRREGQAQGKESSGSRKRGRSGAGKGCDEGLGGKGQGWGKTPQHVNLFSEAERESEKQLGQNAEYQREKQEDELRAQRRSGLAPTALGDGSAELKGADSQPWYVQVKASEGAASVAARTTRLGREVTGEEATEALKRDEKRKDRADPLVSLFRSSSYATVIEKSNENHAEQSVTPYHTSSADSRGPGGSPNEGGRKTSSKKEKKHKHKKHKKHKKRKSNLYGNSGAEDDYSRGDSGDSTTEVTREQRLDDLRRRRLAREGGERERQIRPLAERQMAGQPFPDERRMSYNNQYNATVARQNRLH